MLAKFPSPSRGSYISTKSEIVTTNSRCFVLVPFSGFLYLYKKLRLENFMSFVLVPFSGFLYLYKYYVDSNFINVCVLVPFPGFLYLYCSPNMGTLASIRVLVPFPGFLYLYTLFMILDRMDISSRPLPGVLISLL